MQKKSFLHHTIIINDYKIPSTERVEFIALHIIAITIILLTASIKHAAIRAKLLHDH